MIKSLKTLKKHYVKRYLWL